MALLLNTIVEHMPPPAGLLVGFTPAGARLSSCNAQGWASRELPSPGDIAGRRAWRR